MPRRRPSSSAPHDDHTHLRGFGSMAPARQRALASEGGKAVHAAHKAYKWTPEKAKIAGRKGGLAKARHRSAGTSQSASAPQSAPAMQLPAAPSTTRPGIDLSPPSPPSEDIPS